MIKPKPIFTILAGLALAFVGVCGVFADATIVSNEIMIMDPGETIIIDGSLTIQTNATLDASSANTNVSLSNDWTNSGTFNAGTSNTTTFTDAAQTSEFTGATTFCNLTCNTASKPLTFQAATTQTITNTLTLNGQATGTKILLRSSVPGTGLPANRFTFNVTGAAQAVNFVDVQDSNASTNNITDINYTNSGNNDNAEAAPHWIFGGPAITYPVTGSTVGTKPTIIGTAGASDSVQIYALVGGVSTVVATVTADTNGKFRVKQSDFTTNLDLNANTLTPKASGVNGTTINITVANSTTTDQVPTIVTPANNERMNSLKPIITGKGLASQTVTLYASDTGGNLLLTAVATSTTDASGNYTINAADYTTNLPKGTVYLNVTVNSVNSLVTTVVMTDPFGVVFDSISDTPISGAVVTIYDSTGYVLVPGDPARPDGCQINAGDTNPQTTNATGAYSYLCSTANGYRIGIVANGYTYPSTQATFPVGRTIVTGSKGESFNVGVDVIEMDHPMDPQPTLLKIEKKSNKKEVTVGDIVTYTLSISNLSGNDVTGVYIQDMIPPGFKYLEGRALLNNSVLSDPSGHRPVTFDIGTVPTTGATLKYQLVVGSGVTFGNYENVAHAQYINGPTISNYATCTVKIIADPLFDLGTVIGKVFWDINKDGVQNEPRDGVIERGVGNARVAMEDGTFVTTDLDGKFHIPAITPGTHVFRIDERSLPEGAVVTTRREQILNITQGLLAKVNFGVVYLDEEKMKQSAAGIVAPVSVVKSSDSPKPRLNISLFNNPLIISNGYLKEPAEFKIFSNYALFINKWQIEIFDKAVKKLIDSIEGDRESMFKPVIWDGLDSKGKSVKPERVYTYKLTVFGDGKKADTTQEREFNVILEQAPEEPDPFEKVEAKEKQKLIDRQNWLIAENKANILDKQSIIVDGEMLQVSSPKATIKKISIIKGDKIIEEIPIVHKKLTAKDILANPQAADDQSATDVIVPRGKYAVSVDYGESATQNNVSSVAVNSTTVDGYLPDAGQGGESLNYRKDVTVGDDYFFLVGMGELMAGETAVSGNVESVQQDNQFKDGLWVDGKLAYYLKAKIKGKYLITSSLDTRRKQSELFKYIDPNKYYPIYGDASQLDQSATGTQGPFYLLVEWDKSQIKWGDYETAFTDTELSTYKRTLYGGKAYYESLSSTQFGDPNTKFVVFDAKAKQKPAHNEFVGTGGSLYYLKHKNITEGSDKIQIQVRDKINGLILATVEQKNGVDYQINYDEGRIIFWRPISYISESSTIISPLISDGNKVYVVADYEYETRDKYDEAARGARVSQQISDYVRLGTTYVKEEKDQKNFELKGYDATIQVDNNTKVVAEYALTKSDDMNGFISTDGGINFTQIGDGEFNNGKAISVKGETKLLNKINVGTYYQKVEKGFSTAGTLASQGSEKYGVRSNFLITDNTEFNLWHDVQRLLDDGNLQTETQIGANKTETSTAQFIQHWGKVDITGEYRRQRTTDPIIGIDTETNTNTDTAAARIDFHPLSNLDFSIEEEVVLKGGNSKKTTFGADYRPNDNLRLNGFQVVGTDGAATYGGIGGAYKINKNITVSASQTIGAATQMGINTGVDVNLTNNISASVAHTFNSTGEGSTRVGALAKLDENKTISGDISQTGETRVASLTGRLKMEDDSEVYGTVSQENALQTAPKSTVTIGSLRKFDKGVELRSERSFIKSDRETAVGSAYTLSKDYGGKKIQGKLTQQATENDTSVTQSNILGLTGEFNDKFAVETNIEKGIVNNLDLTKTDRYAISVASSYVDSDKIKASLKLEGRFDRGAEDSRQFLAYWAGEAKIKQDLTLFSKANLSQTQNLTQGTTSARYKEIVTGAAYRPLYNDRLNFIAKYTYLEDDSPSSQEDYQDIEKERSHVLGFESVYDVNYWNQLVGKIAVKQMEEKVSGFSDYTRTQTWLGILRLNHRFLKDYELGLEYRLLHQIQAQDYKQGTLLELSRYFGTLMKLGIGYNFSGLTDDLAHENYSTYGWFVRVTSSLGEVANTLMRTKEQKIQDFKIASERVYNEISKLPKEQMQEEEIKFYRDQAKYWIDMGEYKEANNCLQKGLKRAEEFHNERLKKETQNLSIINRIKIDELMQLEDKVIKYKKEQMIAIKRLIDAQERQYMILQLFYETGKMYFQAKQYQKALNEWRMGLELSKEIGSNHDK